MKNTTRKIFSLILCFIMLFGAAPLNGIAEHDFSKLNIFGGINLPDLYSLFTPKASAENVTSGTCGDNLTWELDEETGTLTISGEGIMTGTFSEDTRIKNVIIESGVTGISQGAFSWCDKLTSVSIPDSVTSIGAGAFSRCTMLSEITIPKGISDLGSGMLFCCTGLTILNYNAKECSGDAFWPPQFQTNGEKIHWLVGCENLKTINIGSNVESVPWYAFSGCTALETVNYNAVNCAGMGFSSNNNWLSGCGNIKTVNIGDSVETIPKYAFYNCTGLTSITIPESVTSIADSAFSGCTGLTDIYYNGNEEDWYSITNGSLSSFVIHFSDGHYINADSGKLAYSIKDEEAVITGIKSPLDGGILVIPEILDGYRLTGIGSFAFHNCTGLTSITIPGSVTSIGDNAFVGCTGLKSVTFGESVRSIGEGAFLDCDGLTKVNYTGTVADWCSISFSRGSNPAYYSQSLYINDIQLTEITEADLID
ncbi:MAG: leucine-rich repeat domain-containing protein, partial [Clostridia bacterium]|nr:leucine-rich repeat domain-containing protein [Clostridia bacterium]